MSTALGIGFMVMAALGGGFWWMRLRPASPYALSNPADRRRHERLPIRIVVELQLPSERCLAGQSRDLSRGGVFAMLNSADQTMPTPETELPVALLLPSAGGAIRLQTRARIVRHEAEGVALAFTAMSHETYENLGYLVNHNAELERLAASRN